MASSNPLQVIDISSKNDATGKEILDAAITQGFLMVEGHSFSQREVDELFALSEKFFNSPLEEKRKHAMAKDNCGYTGFGDENLDEKNPGKKIGDPKEAFNLGNLNFETGNPEHDLPPVFNEPANKKIIQNAILKLKSTVLTILELLAIGLEIDKDQGGPKWFTERFSNDAPCGSIFRFLHYPSPKTLNPEESVRAGAHTDYGAISLLFQKQHEEGLELFSPVSNKWEPVPFVSGSDCFKNKGLAPPIVVNIADLLSYWTNGVLKSTLHRVRFPKQVVETGRSRYSIVFFSHPTNDTLLEPVPSDLVRAVKGRGASEQFTKHGISLTAKEHLEKRLAASYGWY